MYRPISEYYELPNKYNETIVRLLVQSPTRIYAYWEVNEEAVKKIKANYNECTPVLKITNLTMNYSYEVEIDPYATNYYIDVKDANCNYKVELGRKYNNEYISIFQSNQVTVPRSMPLNQNETDEVIYRNYLRLSETEKFKVYYNKNRYNEKNKQEYYGLNFSADDGISSGETYKK